MHTCVCVYITTSPEFQATCGQIKTGNNYKLCKTVLSKSGVTERVRWIANHIGLVDGQADCIGTPKASSADGSVQPTAQSQAKQQKQ